jgi:hypothetical protein
MNGDTTSNGVDVAAATNERRRVEAAGPVDAQNAFKRKHLTAFSNQR